MNTTVVLVILLVILAALCGLLFWMYRKGDKMQKQQDEQKAQLQAAAQPCTMLVIDKKKMALKDAGLPQQIIAQTPKRAMNAKVPVVKAKVGPRIMTLLADEDVYDLIPVKAEIKAMVSGIYITSINNFRKAPVPVKEKKTFMEKLRGKSKESHDVINNAKAEQAKKKKKK